MAPPISAPSQPHTHAKRGNQTHRYAKTRPKLKLAVRHLPPALPAAAFRESAGEWVDDAARVAWWDFVPGKPGKSKGDPPTPSRAYIVFTAPEHLVAFVEEYSSHVFADAAGRTYSPTLEFAVYQHSPASTRRTPKVDNRCGTIEADDGFVSFLEELAGKKAASSIGSATGVTGSVASIGSSVDLATAAGGSARTVAIGATGGSSAAAPTTTPLLEFLKARSQRATLSRIELKKRRLEEKLARREQKKKEREARRAAKREASKRSKEGAGSTRPASSTTKPTKKHKKKEAKNFVQQADHNGRHYVNERHSAKTIRTPRTSATSQISTVEPQQLSSSDNVAKPLSFPPGGGSYSGNGGRKKGKSKSRDTLIGNSPSSTNTITTPPANLLQRTGGIKVTIAKREAQLVPPVKQLEQLPRPSTSSQTEQSPSPQQQQQQQHLRQSNLQSLQGASRGGQRAARGSRGRGGRGGGRGGKNESAERTSTSGLKISISKKGS